MYLLMCPATGGLQKGGRQEGGGKEGGGDSMA